MKNSNKVEPLLRGHPWGKGKWPFKAGGVIEFMKSYVISVQNDGQGITASQEDDIKVVF